MCCLSSDFEQALDAAAHSNNHALSSLGDLVIRLVQVFLYVLDLYQSAWERDSFSRPHPVINALLLLPFPNNFLDNIASVFYTAERWGTSSQPEDKNAVFFQDSRTGPPFAEHHGKSFAKFWIISVGPGAQECWFSSLACSVFRSGLLDMRCVRLLSSPGIIFLWAVSFISVPVTNARFLLTNLAGLSEPAKCSTD